MKRMLATLALLVAVSTGCDDGCRQGERVVDDPPLWMPITHIGTCSGGYGGQPQTCTPTWIQWLWVPQSHCERGPLEDR